YRRSRSCRDFGCLKAAETYAVQTDIDAGALEAGVGVESKRESHLMSVFEKLRVRRCQKRKRCREVILRIELQLLESHIAQCEVIVRRDEASPFARKQRSSDRILGNSCERATGLKASFNQFADAFQYSLRRASGDQQSGTECVAGPLTEGDDSVI